MRTAVCRKCGAKHLKWAQNSLGMAYLVDFRTGRPHHETCKATQPQPNGTQPDGDATQPQPQPQPSTGYRPVNVGSPQPDAGTPQPDAGTVITREWVAYVQALRKRAAELKMRVVISPRASIFGASLLRERFPLEFVRESCVFKGMSTDDRQKLAGIEFRPTGYRARSFPVPTNGDHKLQPFLDALVKIRPAFNIMLVGAAGSGKTTAARKSITGANLAYVERSMGPATSQWDLLGFVSPATGTYVPGIMREPFENGGGMCLDEIDNTNPSALTALNSGLSNGHYTFPDNLEIVRHPDFICIACANTYGRGADRIYVGRQQLDGATLDRFLVVEWDYDESAEATWAGGH